MAQPTSRQFLMFILITFKYMSSPLIVKETILQATIFHLHFTTPFRVLFFLLKQDF